MSRKASALAELETVYAKIRSDIDNAGPDADFSFVSTLIIYEQSSSGDKKKVSGFTDFITSYATTAFGETMPSFQRRIPIQIETQVKAGQIPCSTMQN